MNSKIKKHKDFLSKYKYNYLATNKNLILFGYNTGSGWHKLHPYFVIDIKERKVYGYGITSHLFYWEVIKNISGYCYARYKFYPKYETVSFDFVELVKEIED